MEADYSGKMTLLLDILSKNFELGDKVLVFSQSLTTLDLVEFYLAKLQINGKEGKHWKRGKDWYRHASHLKVSLCSQKLCSYWCGSSTSICFLLVSCTSYIFICS
jgi:hypothetical protein